MHLPLILFTFAALLGLAVGSFATMLLWRLPRSEAVGGRSRCTACGHALAWCDLIPLVSFLLLRGKCRFCRKRISLRYPLLEALSALVFILAAFALEREGFIAALLIAISAELLLLIAFHDVQTQTIPDLFNFLLILAGLSVRLMTGDLSDAFSGAAVPLLLFGALWIASGGKWIGTGDILLGAGIGLLLGFRLTLLALFLAYGLGAIVVIIFLACGRATRGSRIAFGPFLSTGALIALFAGEVIIRQHALSFS